MVGGSTVLLAALTIATFGGISLAGCGSSGSSSSEATDPRVDYEDGNPAETVIATPTDATALKYNVAWWEASAQDFSLVAADGYAPTVGENRVGIVFFGHAADGTTLFSGQVVLDSTQILSLPPDATLDEVALAFRGSAVQAAFALPAADANSLMESVVDSMSQVPDSALSGSSLTDPSSLQVESLTGVLSCVTSAVKSVSSVISSALKLEKNCKGCGSITSVLAKGGSASSVAKSCQSCATEVLSYLKKNPTKLPKGCSLPKSSKSGSAKDAGKDGSDNDGSDNDGSDDGGSSSNDGSGGADAGGSGSGGDGGGASTPTCDNSENAAPAP
jgi:hypothetical protein